MSSPAYLLSLLCILAAAWQIWRTCTKLLRPASSALAALIFVTLIIYLGALIPGILGLFTADGISTVQVILSLAAAIVFWRLERAGRSAVPRPAPVPPRIDAAGLAVACAGTIALL